MAAIEISAVIIVLAVETFNYIWMTSTLQRIYRSWENTIPISGLLFGYLDPYFTVWWREDAVQGMQPVFVCTFTEREF